VLGSLVYSPRLQICYGWDLIGALTRLRDQPIHGLVIGDGNGLPWLRAQASEAGVLDRITFAGRIPYAEVQPALRLFDFALSTQTNNLAGQVRTTGKLPEYMAAGRFVLASRVGDAEVLLPEPMLVDFHGTVDRAYPERLAERMRRVQADPGLQRLAGTLPELARQHCSYPVLRRRFHEVVEKLHPSDPSRE
jgi:glycosyltransferase involved in cell wall biosynthesis